MFNIKHSTYNYFLEGEINTNCSSKGKLIWKEKMKIAFPISQQKELIGGPVRLKMVFWLKNTKQRRQYSRIDLDNMIKVVLDCLTGVLYKDDKQVIEIYARKDLNPVLNGLSLEVFIGN